MKKIIPMLISSIFLGACATQNVSKEESFDKNLFNLEIRLNLDDKLSSSFGSKPDMYIETSDFIEKSVEHFNKSLLAYTKVYPYIENNGRKGYIACLIDKQNKFETVFFQNKQISDSTKLTPQNPEIVVELCKSLKSYEKNHDASYDKVENYNAKYIEKLHERELNTPALLVSKIFIDNKVDYIKPLINKVASLEKKPKDEYTKTSDYKALLDEFKLKNYTFITNNKNKDNLSNWEIKYNVDTEVLNVKVKAREEDFILNNNGFHYNASYILPTVALDEENEDREYVGQNAFGVKAKVNAFTIEKYGVAINNIKNNNEIFKASIPMSVSQAKLFKNDLEFYLKVEPTTSDNFKGNIFKSIDMKEATIQDPVSLTISGSYILVNIKEIGVFRKSTGEILAIKKYAN